MLRPYRAICVIFVSFLVSACGKAVILSPSESVVAVSPISISSGGSKMWISESNIRLLSEESRLQIATINKLGIEGEKDYAREDLEELLTKLNNIDFESHYIQFTRSVVVPDRKTNGAYSPEIIARITKIVRSEFLNDIENFYKIFGPAGEVERFSLALERAEKTGDPSALLYYLELTEKRVSHIRRAKLILSDWLTSQMAKYTFTRSLRITIDIASQTGAPILTAQRAYARIYCRSCANPFSYEFSLTEAERECRYELLACRIVLVHRLEESSPEIIKELVDSFRLLEQSLTNTFQGKKDESTESTDLDSISVRDLVDSLEIDLQLLVNGREAFVILPGRFMNVTLWEENR